MNKRIIISSGTKWENAVGYSRSVRVGKIVEVAGTTSAEGDSIIGVGNAYVQTKHILSKIEKALNEAGAQLGDVIRTRIYVTDIRQWEQVGKAHGEFFSNIKPVTTLVEVKGLIHADMLVEIEAGAIISS